jgi:hypothetical protein
MVVFPTGGLSVVIVHPGSRTDESSGMPPAPPSHAVSFGGSISQENTSVAGAAISTRLCVSMPMGDNVARERPP